MKELPTPTLDLSPIALPRGSLHLQSPLCGELAPACTNGLAGNGTQAASQGITVAWARHLDEVREAQQLSSTLSI